MAVAQFCCDDNELRVHCYRFIIAIIIFNGNKILAMTVLIAIASSTIILKIDNLIIHWCNCM